MLVNPYQQDLTKITNSIMTLGKNQSSFNGIIKFVLVQKRNQFQLNLLEATLEILRQRQFNVCAKLFSNEQIVINLIKDCPLLEILALILKQCHLYMEADTYNYGPNILEAVYQQVKLIKSRMQQHDCFKLVPIDDFGVTKKNDPSKIWNKITPQIKLAYQARIFLMIDYIINPLIQYYSDKQKSILDEFRIAIKWLIFISDNGDNQKQNIIMKLGQKILPKICSPISTLNGNLLYCFNVMMRVMALPLYDQQIIKPMYNMGVFLHQFPQIVINKLIEQWLKTIKVGDLPKEGIYNIINNLFDCTAQFQALKIVDYLTKLLRKENNLQMLQVIYENIMKKKLVTRVYLTASSFKLALDILLYYVVGFVNSDKIGAELDVLVANYKNPMEQLHFKQIMGDASQMVTISLNMMCFKSTSVKPLIFLLSLCQFRFNSLSPQTLQILKQLKKNYEIQIDFFDLEKYVKNNMFELGGTSMIKQHVLIPSKRYKGLENIGNTCYMNSFLQVLYTTTRFNTLISHLGDPANQQQSIRPCFLLHQLFTDLQMIQNIIQDPVAPYKFKKYLMQPFASSKDQQDSAQFGRLYLELLLNDFAGNQYFSKQLERLFFNRTRTQLMCRRCSSKTNKQEKILDYILPLNQTAKQPEFISTLFKSYFAQQNLDENNLLFCNKCQSKQQISTKTDPLQFSTAVILTLNRFLYDKTQQKRVKLLNPVALQLQIDIRDITPNAPSCKYTLQSFIIHIGSNAQSGHYVTYARNIEQNPYLWYVFDDGYVSQRQIIDVKEFDLGQFETPYILVYNSQQSVMSSIKMSDSIINSSRISMR